jgi:hypothetical protein
MIDPAFTLQRAEERACTCSAVGSGEEHEPWCKARKFDRIPEDMTAAEALRRLKIGAGNR